jgi:hypothetical protein
MICSEERLACPGSVFPPVEVEGSCVASSGLSKIVETWLFRSAVGIEDVLVGVEDVLCVGGGANGSWALATDESALNSPNANTVVHIATLVLQKQAAWVYTHVFGYFWITPARIEDCGMRFSLPH